MTARRRDGTILGTAAAALMLLAVGPTPAAAQEQDARWLPWLGCWEAVGAPDDEAMLCFRPAGEGVDLLTVGDDGQVSATESLTADGQAREVAAEGCSGTERVAFSADQRRIYLASEQTCEGGARRDGSGLIAMISPHTWLDVKSVDVAGERSAWVQTYQVADPERVRSAGLEDLAAGRGMAVGSARVAAATAPTVEAVIDASAHVHDEAVRAWLAETGEPMDVDADRLVEMADAGVSPEVIDVVVAVSHPDVFALDAERGVNERPGERAVRRPYGDGYGAYGYGRFSPFYWDPFYSSFGYGYRYGPGSYYGPYGYGGYYYRPRIIVVTERDDQDHGRVVNGRGYRSGRPSAGAPSSAPSVRPAPTRRPSAGAPPSRPSTTRRAKPRGGGGGGA